MRHVTCDPKESTVDSPKFMQSIIIIMLYVVGEVDIELMSESVTFEVSSTMESAILSVLTDSSIEGNELFEVSLVASDPQVTQSSEELNVHIIDMNCMSELILQ